MDGNTYTYVSNSKSLFLILLFVVLSIGVFVFMVNPYHILDRFKLYMIFIFFFICFGIFYFIESHFKEDTSESLPESMAFFWPHFLCHPVDLGIHIGLSAICRNHFHHVGIFLSLDHGIFRVIACRVISRRQCSIE